MKFDQEQRAILAALADVLIPAGDGFPSASEAGVASEGLDHVLNCRPELLSGLSDLIAAARGHVPAEFLRDLQNNDPAAFAILTDLVPGAYFLNPAVRAKLGYGGQTPQPIDPREDYLDDGLLQSVIDRGAIYRPTPARSSSPNP
jgi:hypothetical protein